MFRIWQKLHFHARAYHMYVRHCKIVLSMYRYNDFRTVFFLLFFAALYQVFAIAQVIRSLVLCISSLFFHHLFLLLLHLRRLLAAYLIFSQLSWHLCIRPTIESIFFFFCFPAPSCMSSLAAFRLLAACAWHSVLSLFGV